ncbi:MAG TPA: two-component regulator propeller domain-containing protein, partial [Bacteroidota bacterium]|nr:two-component regulator propeller domain-containing protein [Bacteroidota bacterium]
SEPGGSTVTTLSPVLLKISGLHTVLEADNGMLWIGSTEGLIRFNLQTGKRERFSNIGDDPTSLSDNTVLSLFRDRSGILWVGTFGGINKYVPARKRFTTIQCDPDGSMGPRANRVRSFTEDRFGKIWIGTESGLYRMDPSNHHFDRFANAPGYPRTLNVNHIWAVTALSDSPGVTIMCATNGGGVNVLRFPEHGNPLQPEMEYIQPNRKNALSLPAPGPSCLLEDRQGFVWIGTLRDGLARYNKRSKTFEVFKHQPGDPTSISNRSITTVLQTRDGTIWVGTRGGFNRFNESEKNFTRFVNDPADPNSLSDDGIECLYEDDDGSIWIGTTGGLNRFDRTTGRFRRYTTEDGLPNDLIYGVLKDSHGNLWCSTNRGIARFRPEGGLINSFDVSDGLQSDEFNQGAAFKASDGTFYFGGIEGFNAFHPESVQDNPHTPNVTFTDLRVLNRSLRIGQGETRLLQTISSAQELFLTYEDQVITIQFAGLEFTNPSRNQYMFKMEGFDKDWTYSGTRREATYTNLDPATYTFRVRGANNDGVWNTESRTMVIHIAPPFWKTWWFRLLAIATLIALVATAVQRRIQTLRKEAALQVEISRRLIESQEQERRRIATDLHDGLGQDLLIIKNRATIANEVPGLSETAKQQIEIIGRTASQSLQSVRQIAKDLRPYHLDRLGLAAAIRSTLEQVAGASRIAFDVRIDDLGQFFEGKKDLEVNVFRVVQEGVNNILKHSGASNAWVRVEKSDGEVHIEIRDDGKGFDPSTVGAPDSKAGLGIAGMAERLKVLGGTYNVDSSPGSGTKISMVIPKSGHTAA